MFAEQQLVELSVKWSRYLVWVKSVPVTVGLKMDKSGCNTISEADAPQNGEEIVSLGCLLGSAIDQHVS